MSWPPTLFDSTDFQSDPDRYSVSASTELRPAMTVRAPCCGRLCAADGIVDLRGTPGTRCRPAGDGGEVDLDFACDGCRWRIERQADNGWTRAKLHRALGAPSSEVRQTRAKEIAREKRQAAMDRDGEAKPIGRYVRDEIERMSTGMPAGTRPPDVE